MEQYFISILTISVIGGIITTLLPEKSSGLKKYLSYIIGLISIITLLSPLTKVIDDVSSFKNNIDNFYNETISQEAIDKTNSLIITSGIEKVEDGIKAILIEKYKLNESEINVTASVNKDDISAVKITQLTITLRGKATWEDSNKIKEYLESMVGCEIKIQKL